MSHHLCRPIEDLIPHLSEVALKEFLGHPISGRVTEGLKARYTDIFEKVVRKVLEEAEKAYYDDLYDMAYDSHVSRGHCEACDRYYCDSEPVSWHSSECPFRE